MCVHDAQCVCVCDAYACTRCLVCVYDGFVFVCDVMRLLKLGHFTNLAGALFVPIRNLHIPQVSN